MNAFDACRMSRTSISLFFDMAVGRAWCFCWRSFSCPSRSPACSPRRVVPLLVQGAAMPAEAQLPPSLVELAYKTALPVRPDPDFKPDMQKLIAALRA